MVRDSVIKRFMAAAFVVMLAVGFIRNGSYCELDNIAAYLKQDVETVAKDAADAEDVITVDSLESAYADSMWMQSKLINLNGFMARKLSMQGFYSDQRIYITDDNYIVSLYAETSTDYEVEQTVALKEFLDANGIRMLYVNEPTKYTDDSLFAEEFGLESYSNRNMDKFLERIRAAGVDTIDLRDNIAEEGINVRDLFYRTDHHWTTAAGLWASSIIAEGMNRYCGYSIDTSIYDTGNYIFTSWKSCWLGEQGRKVAVTYVGLDDYTEIKPDFETSYHFKTADEEGTFDNFINEDVYNTENDVYKNGSWHYSYSAKSCINHNVDYGKVLILGDSYESVTLPFLSLGIHEIDIKVLRDQQDDFNLRDYILENGYDTVLVLYAQFMVGAHDSETNANYRMFAFE